MPDVTITLTTEQAQRLSAAIGDIIHEDKSPANLAEGKDYTIKWWKILVRAYERRQAEAQVVLQSDIDPT